MKLRAVFAGLVALAGAPAALAHPHFQVDQQALLSLTMDGAHLRLVIMPSVPDGPEILRFIDLDADGSLTPSELRAFADTLLTHARMSHGGVPVALSPGPVSMPPPAEIAAGTAAISIEAVTDLDWIDAADLTLEMRFAVFDQTWFLQPFFDPEFQTTFPDARIERPEESNAITVRPLP